MATAALPSSIAPASPAVTARSSTFALSAVSPGVLQVLLATVLVLMAVASFTVGYLNA